MTRIVVLLMVIVGCSNVVNAAKKTIDGNIKILTEYQSNRSMSAQKNDDTIITALLDLAYTRNYRYASFNWKQGLQMLLNREQQQYNTEAVYNSVSLSRYTQLAASSIEFKYTRDTTLATDATLFGFDIEKKWRNTYTLRPVLQYATGPRTEMTMTAYFQQVKYENMIINPIYDYDYYMADTGVSYKLSSVSKVSPKLFYSKMTADVAGNTTVNFGVNLDYENQLSKRFRSTLSFGIRKSDFQSGSDVSSDIGGLALFNLNYYGFIYDAGLLVQRGLEPSGSGTMLQKDEVKIYFLKKLNVKSRISTSLKFIHNYFLQTTQLTRNSDYLYGTIKHERKLSKTSSLSFYLTGIAQQFSPKSERLYNKIVGLEFTLHNN